MYYYTLNKYLRDKFREKVRRVSLNPGFPCPHKDRVSGSGGCAYCNERGFSELAGTDLPVNEQLSMGIRRLSALGINKYIAYFQNATATNADPEELRDAYDQIKGFPGIVALSISTRPDCVDDEKLDLIAGYGENYDVWIEYGMQSVHDRTLVSLNRGHTFACTRDAIEKTARRGIKAAVHVILGLPGESRDEMVATAREIAAMPVWGVKLHVFHVLKNTPIQDLYVSGKINLMSSKEYASLACDFLENLRRDQVILRLVSNAAPESLVAPLWMNRKLKVLSEIDEEFRLRGTAQGSHITCPDQLS
jgi:uncharacterized protein